MDWLEILKLLIALLTGGGAWKLFDLWLHWRREKRAERREKRAERQSDDEWLRQKNKELFDRQREVDQTLILYARQAEEKLAERCAELEKLLRSAEKRAVDREIRIVELQAEVNKNARTECDSPGD